jgi:hypothetical protein
MNAERYNEAHIKCDFLNYLRASKIINARSIIASEYVLGTTGRRADLAVHNGSRFIGIEVKSRYDTLIRLRDQLKVYTACFDEVMLVLDERHIDEGLEIASDEVAVFEIGHNRQLSLRRAATVEPLVDSEMRLQLLTMQELKKLIGYNVSLPVKRSSLLEQATELPEEIIENTIADVFRQNFTETSEVFWRRVKRKRVTLDALGCLSRFALERINWRAEQHEKDRFWEAWRKDAFIALKEAAA